MRIIITDETRDFSELVRSFARHARGADATLERVKALNPHLADAKKLAAGTVVILPDSPDLKPGVGKPVGVHTVTDFAEGLRAGLRDLEARHREFAAKRKEEQASVREALKSAAAKRLVDGDPVLKERLAAAEAAFKAEQKEIAETEARLAEGAKHLEAELENLGKLRV
jgi:hypothetical protein